MAEATDAYATPNALPLAAKLIALLAPAVWMVVEWRMGWLSPKPVTDKLEAAMKKIMTSAEIKQRMESVGFVVPAQLPSELDVEFLEFLADGLGDDIVAIPFLVGRHDGPPCGSGGGQTNRSRHQ